MLSGGQQVKTFQYLKTNWNEELVSFHRKLQLAACSLLELF